VELGDAPASIIAAQTDTSQPDGRVIRTRPVYAYPQSAVYTGSGSIDEAANFKPGLPSPMPSDDFDWVGLDLFNEPVEGR
jgi:feruloyl esterase